MKIDGNCLCGLITYEATINPEMVAICHCTDCQINSGSAFRVIVQVGKDNFHLTTGQLKTYAKTAASGARRALAFCPECGTHLYGADAVNPQTFSLRIGTSRQAKQLTPSLQIWRRSAFAWVSGIETRASFDEQAPPPRITGTQ